MAIHGQVGRAPARRQSIRGAFPSVTSHFAVGALATFPLPTTRSRASLGQRKGHWLVAAITHARLPERVSAHAGPSEDVLRQSIWPGLLTQTRVCLCHFRCWCT